MNMQAMLKQAQKLQKEMMNTKDEMDQLAEIVSNCLRCS